MAVGSGVSLLVDVPLVRLLFLSLERVLELLEVEEVGVFDALSEVLSGDR